MESQMFMKPPPNMSELSTAPPNVHLPPPSMSAPPPNMSVPPPNIPGNSGPPSHQGGYAPRFGSQQYQPRQYFRPFQPFVPRGPIGPMTLEDFDGKRLRKSVMRKTVDYNSAIIEALETRVWQRDFRDRRALQPDVMYYPELLPPPSYPENAINCVTTRFVKTATNKMRCPIFCMAWTPEGRRLVTGASSGEFTLWNGLTFNFETILQAHDSPVRTMVWSHNDNWMVTGDHAGYVKYWQSNMNNVKMFQAHKEALRGISFSPMDSKFATCSDDGTLRIWDFLRCHEEHVLRGHGADVKCVQWHPQKGLIISGSKDNQQPIKLWDPKTGQALATLHAHKSTVMDLKWNDNGNWLITASRDHLLKLFDLRNLNQEIQTFRGHKKEASSVAWHPSHEGLFASGGSDGSIMFWHVGADKEVGAIEQAHDSIVWTLAWHPLGHILCSGSNDHSSKFWTRNRPGDMMRDKYNLNTLPAGLSGLDDAETDEPSVIPGMGPEDKVEVSTPVDSTATMTIPGLDLDAPPTNAEDKPNKLKKVPYSKPIPRNFQAQWNDTEDEGPRDSTISEVITHIVENTPGVVPLQKIAPSAIIVYGKVLPVEPGSTLEKKIAEGPEALKRYIASGAIEELHDVMPHEDEDDYLNDEYADSSETSVPTLSASNIVLPKPLPSSKLNLQNIIQSNTRQGQMDMSHDRNKGERPRKSRFSDINDSNSTDKDMRGGQNQFIRPLFPPGSIEGQQNNMGSINMNSNINMNTNTNFNNEGDRRGDNDRRIDHDFRDTNHDQGYRNSINQPMYPDQNCYDEEEEDEYDRREEDSPMDSPKRPRFENYRSSGGSGGGSSVGSGTGGGGGGSGGNNDDQWQYQQQGRSWDTDNGNFNQNHPNGMNNFGSGNPNDNFNRAPNFGQTSGPMFRPPGPPGPNFRPPYGNPNYRNDGPPGGWGGPPPQMRMSQDGGFRGNRGGFGHRGHRGQRPMRGGRGNGARGPPQRGRNTFN